MAKPPSVPELLQTIPLQRVIELITDRVVDDDKYFHWDDLRYRQPPDGLSREEWWFALRSRRTGQRRTVPLMEDDQGQHFYFGLPDRALEMLHRIDGSAQGRLAAPDGLVNPATRNRYIVSSLIEEATRSSQLEGAITTRKEAQRMIRAGAEPRNKHERMILNNYLALEFVREMRAEPLTPEAVLELHAVVTDGTLDDPSAPGRLQTPEEVRVTVRDADDKVFHWPPPAEELPVRLARMCDFANEDHDPAGFTHPVVRAIILHFWLAYDHPFVDGNGRTARAIFYWSMLHSGYWLTEFLSISGVLRQAPAKYRRSFRHTETDDNDLTYFILYQLSVICRAIDSLDEYLAKKSSEIVEVERLLQQDVRMNHRQLALLSHALRNPRFRYTYRSHMASHRITRQTATADMGGLVQQGLLEKVRAGREVSFIPPDDLSERLRQLKGA